MMVIQHCCTVHTEIDKQWGCQARPAAAAVVVLRTDTLSAGPLKTRAATAISGKGEKPFIEFAIDYSKANAPMAQDLYSEDVGSTACFLLSPLARAITGMTIYVDNGLHSMAMAVDSGAMSESPIATAWAPQVDYPGQ